MAEKESTLKKWSLFVSRERISVVLAVLGGAIAWWIISSRKSAKNKSRRMSSMEKMRYTFSSVLPGVEFRPPFASPNELRELPGFDAPNTRQHQLEIIESDVLIVQESWGLLKPFGVEPAMSRTYNILAEIDPSALRLFRAHVDWNAQHKLLAVMMSTIVSKLAHPQELQDILESLGRRHRAWGVKPEHFISFGDSIVEGVKQTLQERWNEDYEKAWKRVFHEISLVMQYS